ncbi:hypothetical protein C0584_03985 [Candidatus Parcubacteria bacterium]|nr:MAG: hypothetical protein C0584_03985 [Candidatus Parcubacteria bacterium]
MINEGSFGENKEKNFEIMLDGIIDGVKNEEVFLNQIKNGEKLGMDFVMNVIQRLDRETGQDSSMNPEIEEYYKKIVKRIRERIGSDGFFMSTEESKESKEKSETKELENDPQEKRKVGIENSAEKELTEEQEADIKTKLENTDPKTWGKDES